jgi:hypothetical protein
MDTISAATGAIDGTRRGRQFHNRTGAATVRGGIYLRDLHQSATESTTPGKGSNSIVPMTTAGIACGEVGVALDVVDDNKMAKVVFGEGVPVQIEVDGSGTAIAKGDGLKPVNAADHAVKATLGTDRYHFQALEAATTAGAIIWAILYSSGRL